MDQASACEKPNKAEIGIQLNWLESLIEFNDSELFCIILKIEK